MYFQYAEQKNRRNIINEAFIEYHYNANEEFPIDKWERWGLKEYSFMMCALLSKGNEFSNTIEKIFHAKAEYLKEYHTFIPFVFINLLLKYKENIPESVCEEMEKYLIANAEISMSDAWDFIGINDNTPAMIAASLILSGEYFNENDWIECGKKRLEQLDMMLERREFISEFNSPTYTPITICAIASVAQFSHCCAEMALKIEAKLWKQFLDLAWLPVCNSTGPFSRGYKADKFCQTYNSRILLYMLLGEELTVNPLNTLFSSQYNMDDHEKLFKQLSAVWICMYDYHCPVDVGQEFINRKYPHQVFGKAEISSSSDTYLLDIIKGDAIGDASVRKDNIFRTDVFDAFKTDECFNYPCAVVDIFSYMTERFALGTCTLGFHSGNQTDAFAMYYVKKDNKTESQNDIGAVYCNYCINDDISLVNDAGRQMAFQKDNHCMVLYSPKSLWKTITSAKLSVIYSNYKNLIKKVVSGNKEIYISEFQDGQKIQLP